MGAALYVLRAGLNCTIFEKQFVGGQASTTYEIDNYLGFSSISGSELSEKMHEHVTSYGAVFKYSNVKELSLEGDVKKIVAGKKEFEAKSVILAMGTSPAFLGIEGEEQFRGKGVSYCATCDGMFFRDKVVSVAGGGNTAVEDALYLSPIAKKVYIIHRRDTFRASEVLVEKLKKCENVEFVLESNVTKISGTDRVEKITVSRGDASFEIETDALFVAIGTTPSSLLVKDIVHCDDKGFILTDEAMATNIKGVYAAGDIRKKQLRQVITAVSDGAIAGEEAAKYLNTL